MGEVKVGISADKSCTIKIYKKKLIGKIKDVSKSSVKSFLKNYSLHSNTVYLFSIYNPTKKTKEKVKFSYNLDKKTCSKGGVWVENNNSANPYLNCGVAGYKEIYVPNYAVPAYYQAMSNSSYLKKVEKIAKGATTIALAYAGGAELLKVVPAIAKVATKYDSVSKTAIGAGIIYIAKTMIDDMVVLNIFSLTKAYCKDICNITGYDPRSRKLPSKGMCIDVFTADGTTIYHIKMWDGKTLKGVPGVKGKFTTLDAFDKFD